VKKKKKAVVWPKRAVLRGTKIHETGRELDRLIATEVLGWMNVPSFSSETPSSQATPSFRYLDPVNQVVSLLPLFSTSELAAFDLYLRVRKNHDFCCIGIRSDYSYCVDVSFTLASNTLTPTNPKQLAEIIITDESFAHAMCVAALEAFRYIKKLKESNHALREALKGTRTPGGQGQSS
jgi:hypothetical protein